MYDWIEDPLHPHNTCPGCNVVMSDAPVVAYDLKTDALGLREDPNTDAFTLWVRNAAWPKVIVQRQQQPPFVPAAAAPDDPEDADYDPSDDEEMGDVEEDVGRAATVAEE